MQEQLVDERDGIVCCAFLEILGCVVQVVPNVVSFNATISACEKVAEWQLLGSTWPARWHSDGGAVNYVNLMAVNHVNQHKSALSAKRHWMNLDNLNQLRDRGFRIAITWLASDPFGQGV